MTKNKKRKHAAIDESRGGKKRQIDYDMNKSFMENLTLTNSCVAQLKKSFEADESLKKDSDNIVRKLRFLKQCEGVDVSIVPKLVADCLTLDHLIQLAKKIVYNRENPEEVKEGQKRLAEALKGHEADCQCCIDKAFVKENPDLVPPEVDWALSNRKRVEVCGKIRALKQKESDGEDKSHDAQQPNGEDDEAFIKENLHLGKLSYTKATISPPPKFKYQW